MLEAYDFADHFTIHELACLAIGIDPEERGGIPEVFRAPYGLISRAANVAASAGVAECAARFLAGLTQRELRGRVLYPIWALQRLPWDHDTPPWRPIEGGGRWPEEGYDPGPADTWAFPRYVVADWMAGRAFKPAYDFTRAGGTFAPEFVAEVVGYEPLPPESLHAQMAAKDAELSTLREQLAQAMQAAGRAAADDLNQKERTTLLRLIGGLVHSGWAMDIHGGRLQGIGELRDDLGLNAPDEKTLRKWLQAAAQVTEPLRQGSGIPASSTTASRNSRTTGTPDSDTAAHRSN